MKPSQSSSSWPVRVLPFGLVLALGAAANPALQTPAPAAAAKPAPVGFHVLRSFEVGGDGGWDYLTFDGPGHRLFVSRSSHVMVIDTTTGKVAGDIKDTDGVHGVALAQDLGRGFTSNGKAGTATIFDLKTLATLGTVKTGERPDAILYDAHSKRVFTFNARSADATAIDAATGTVAGSVKLEGKPEAAVSDGAGRIFVNIEDKSEVVCFDADKLEVLSRWPLTPGEEPTGLSLDVKNHRLFAGCGNQKMVVLDSQSGKVITTLAIGEGVDGTAFDAETGCAFSSNGDGTLTVVREVDPATFQVLENAKTARGARTLTLDPKAHEIYLPTAKYEPAPEGSEGKRERPKMIPGSFTILVVGK